MLICIQACTDIIFCMNKAKQSGGRATISKGNGILIRPKDERENAYMKEKNVCIESVCRRLARFARRRRVMEICALIQLTRSNPSAKGFISTIIKSARSRTKNAHVRYSLMRQFCEDRTTSGDRRWYASQSCEHFSKPNHH